MHAAHSWAEVLSPSGVAGILQSIGAVLVAIFSDRPSSGAGISPSRFIDKEPS